MSISNPNDTDSGDYRCEIEISGQPTQSMSHTVTIEPSTAAPVPEERQKRRHQHQNQLENEEKVLQHAIQKPSEREHAAPIALASFMKNLTIEEGGRAKFVCSVVGNVEFIVEWFKNNISLQSDPRYHVTSTDAIVGLEILDVVPSDSGFYTCTIKGQRNSVTSSSKLTVYETYSPRSRKKSLTHDRPPMPLSLSEFIGKGKTLSLSLSHQTNNQIKTKRNMPFAFQLKLIFINLNSVFYSVKQCNTFIHFNFHRLINLFRFTKLFGFFKISRPFI